MRLPRCTFVVPLIGLVLLTGVSNCPASAFVRGAWYRLGDADPGAAPGAVGNDPTTDSFADSLNLARTGSPHYAADTPALGPADDKLSMAFANIGLGGPAFPGAYGRANALPMIEQGMALEAWVKSGPTNLDVPVSSRNELVAYNGNPGTDGFGFFNRDDRYVLHLGSALVGPADGTVEQDLGPADVGVWHHLAYVYSLGTSSFYYDGKLVGQSTSVPAPLAATDGFWIGGRSSAGNVLYGLNGWVDEVRYQTFNPIAAGAFEPTNFLIVPEPTALGLLSAALALGLRRPRR